MSNEEKILALVEIVVEQYRKINYLTQAYIDLEQRVARQADTVNAREGEQ